MFDNLNIDRVAFEIPMPGFIVNIGSLPLWGYLIFIAIGLAVGLVLVSQNLSENGKSIRSLFSDNEVYTDRNLYVTLVISIVVAALVALFVDRSLLQRPFSPTLPIFWYGILVTLGIIVGVLWAAREIEKRGQDVDELYNGVIVVVFAGYIFARLTYVALDVIQGNVDQYANFGQVINIRAGGVNILGGFIGAVIVAILYLWFRDLRIWHYADVAGPALLIAQAIGRWGNFINQELYGPPTTQPWGILIDPQFRLAQFSNLTEFPAETRFHPTFLYESIILLIGFILLLYLNNRYRDQWQAGTLFSVFLIWWGGNRAWIELFRPDQATIGNGPITYSMVIAIIIALFGVYLFLSFTNRLPESARRQRRRKRALKPKVNRSQS